MHKLDWVRICNLRSCLDTKVFLENYSPLVGPNNAGKSNILKAIKWCLRPFGLLDKDFTDPTLKVSVTAKISGVTSQLLESLEENHRTSISPYVRNNVFYIRMEQSTPGGGKTLRKLYVSTGDDTQADDTVWTWKPNPSGLPEALQIIFPEPIFVESMDNATDDVSKYKTSSTIGKLLQLLSAQIENEQHELVEALTTISQRLNFDGTSRLQALNDFDALANQRVQDFFPGVSLKIHVPTPSLSKLFTDGTIKIQEHGREMTDVDSLGHGAQRSIQMGLIRLLAEFQTQIDAGQTTLLLIDEPELYLHPQAIELIRDALKTLSNSNYQIIFSTHAALMIQQEDVPYANIVRKNQNGNTVVTERITEAIASVIDGNINQARILFEIYNMNQILFSDRVLIAEGQTELSVLPHLFKAINRQLSTHKTALVIAEGCTGIHKIGRILHKIGIPFKALVDLDYAFTTARSANLLEDNDETLLIAIPMLSASATRNGFDLEGGTLPRKTGNKKAYIAYDLFAAEEESKQIIQELHEKLKSKGYWLWKKGAIEQHLSLATKTTGDWISFKMRLKNESITDVLDDYENIHQMTIWATSQDITLS